MKLHILYISFLFSAMSFSPAMAAESNETPTIKAEGLPVSKFAELDELRSKNAVLAERVRQLELLDKLRVGNMSAMGTQAANPVVPSSRANQKSSTKKIPPSINAQVQMVSGVGSNNKASIMTSNGTIFNVQVGSRLSDLGTIKSISLNEVIVTTKSGPISIPFATQIQDAPMMQTSGMSSSPTQQMPPFPMGMIPRGAQ